jgi:hypothetical protein
MNRRLLPLLVFTLCVSPVASAQTPPTPPPESPTPAWLPRAAFLGTYIRGGVVAPQARVQWQVPFFRGRRDSLSLIVEPTAAIATSFPDPTASGGSGSLQEDEEVVPLTALRLYGLMLGVGYSNRRESGLEWGFQIGTGPAWYSARFSGASKDRESYFGGLLDGRGQVGYRFGPLSVGVAVGYSDPYNYRRTALARGHLGGLKLGLYADWH